MPFKLKDTSHTHGHMTSCYLTTLLPLERDQQPQDWVYLRAPNASLIPSYVNTTKKGKEMKCRRRERRIEDKGRENEG